MTAPDPSEGRLIADDVPQPDAGDWAEAVRIVRAYYPEDIFPWPSETLEGKAAMMARQTCDNIRREAKRLMEDRLWVPMRATQFDGDVSP